MSEGTVSVNVDLSPVIRGLNQVQDHLFSRINSLENTLVNDLNQIYQTVNAVRNDVAYIQKTLAQMIREQRLSAALQRAITEVIRVRQELEQKFSNQKLVRDNMLGILKATDFALIRSSTISQCTESLMLSTPNYWLSPCLIALAAWISNDKPLAERAIKVANKLNREKTCLLFALITRRVSGRGTEEEQKKHEAVCFRWLEAYFAEQTAKAMKSSVVSFVDAYYNGVFGEDQDGSCEAKIDEWMSQLASDEEFNERQKKHWKEFFSNFDDGVSISENSALKSTCREYDSVNNFLKEIEAVTGENGVRSKILSVANSKVDVEQLKKMCDEQLYKLVNEYEEAEADLRDEEMLLQKIKEFKGDEDKANKYMQVVRWRRRDDPVDFASRLEHAIHDPNISVSEKKTAYRLLSRYITEAYKEYITEGKAEYPEEITLDIKESAGGSAIRWSGKTANGENRKQLEQDLRKQYQSERDEKIAKVMQFKWWQKILDAITFKLIITKNKNKQKAALESQYEQLENKAAQLLNAAIDAREAANRKVEAFIAQDDWDVLKLTGIHADDAVKEA